MSKRGVYIVGGEGRARTFRLVSWAEILTNLEY